MNQLLKRKIHNESFKLGEQKSKLKKKNSAITKTAALAQSAPLSYQAILNTKFKRLKHIRHKIEAFFFFLDT